MQSDRDARIRDRAYQIWMAEGRVHGRHDEHWEQARREVEEEEKQSAKGARARRGDGAAEATGGASRTRRTGSKPATPSEAGAATVSRSRAKLEKQTPKSATEPKSAARRTKAAAEAAAPSRGSRKPVAAK